MQTSVSNTHTNTNRNAREVLTINVDAHTVLHYLEIKSLLAIKSVKVYASRVSIEHRSKLGLWEHRETYPINDFGDIYISKSRSWASVGVHCRDSERILFEIEGLTHRQAEMFKDALDILLDARQQGVRSDRR